MSDVQLAGMPALCASKIADVSALVSAVHIGSPPTVWLKAVTSSAMQAEYCATVAVQFVGMSPHPGLEKEAASDWEQLFCCVVQFCCSTAWLGALLDAAYDRPFHLQAVARGIAVPK